MKAINMQSSVGFRFFVITIIMFILLIPVSMVRSLIKEREVRRNQVVWEVNEKWGGEQKLTGPILTIPFLTTCHDSKGEVQQRRQLLHILPDRLEIHAEQKAEMRYRGIYEVVVYSIDLKFDGQFPELDSLELPISRNDMIWDEAYLNMGISEVQGIRERIQMNWDGKVYHALQGTEDQDLVSSGIHFKLADLTQKTSAEFVFQIKLQGSDQISFAPLGKETDIQIHSNWQHPSFIGQFLPDSRTITDHGYDASWHVLDYNLDFPRYWVDKKHDIANSTLGVTCHVPVDEYQQTMRTTKYAFLFICLTFVAFIMIELLGRQKLHPIQYLLVGLGLVLFYSILLALTEHVRFGIAYAIAATALIVLFYSYLRSAFSQKRFSLITTIVISSLYGYLYIVLLIQDYALLVGNIGLFIILSMIMFLTRKMDWYRVFHVHNQE